MHGQVHLLKWEDNCLKGHSNLSVISTFLTYRAWTHNITKLCSNYAQIMLMPLSTEICA